MGLIAVEGMRFYAYHGYYEEEQLAGNNYIVDVYVGTDFRMAAKADQLKDTINYEQIYGVTSEIMDQKIKLLETIAERISNKLIHLFENIETLKIRVSKLNPPMGGQVDRTFIEVDHDFRKSCGKCQKKFICYTNQKCWCQSLVITPATRDLLNNQFKGCLCEACLEDYAQG